MASLAAIRWADALHAAIARNASDIHFVPGCAPAMRVDGRLLTIASDAADAGETAELAAHFLGEEMLESLSRDGDASASLFVPGAGPMRVHAFRAGGGVHLAIRLLGRSIPSFDSLSLPRAVEDLTLRMRGLLIFSGPTGSGKSSSMAAAIDLSNRTLEKRVVTIEDPVEFRHAARRSSICQREIGRDTPGFESALMGALRSDPDVLAIGEMRTPETIRVALTAAETGHLVLASLHTGDAPQAVDRIVDAVAGSNSASVRAQLGQALTGVVCQRLVPRLHGGGRRPVVEIMVANDAVRNLIREGKTHHLRNAIATGRPAGMQTFESHARELVARGEIDARSVRDLDLGSSGRGDQRTEAS